MAMTLGGRAAEEIVFGEITTGASNDLEKVTATAKQMVMRFGMSEKLGPRVFGHDHGQPFLGREFSAEPDYSDEIAREIDDEIRRIVESAHVQAKDILTAHRESLEKLSEILIKRETIEKEQFEALLDGQTEEEVFGAEAPPPPEVPIPPAPPPSARRARGPAAAAAAGPRRRHRRVASRRVAPASARARARFVTLVAGGATDSGAICAAQPRRAWSIRVHCAQIDRAHAAAARCAPRVPQRRKSVGGRRLAAPSSRRGGQRRVQARGVALGQAGAERGAAASRGGLANAGLAEVEVVGHRVRRWRRGRSSPGGSTCAR